MTVINNKKTVVITGANGNIAHLLAEKYAETECSMILIHRNHKERIEHLFNKYPNRVFSLQTDLLDFHSLETKLVNLVKSNSLDPGYLIHTASERSTDFSDLVDCDIQAWKYVLESNVLTTFHILRAVIPFFKASHFGRIVLFGSNVSRIGLKSGSAYAASKAAIANITRTLALEESKHNILINTCSPGPIEIDASHFDEDYRKFRENYYSNMLSLIPLGRLALPEDVIGLCEFLISDQNKYITGEEFFVTGGKI